MGLGWLTGNTGWKISFLWVQVNLLGPRKPEINWIIKSSKGVFKKPRYESIHLSVSLWFLFQCCSFLSYLYPRTLISQIAHRYFNCSPLMNLPFLPVSLLWLLVLNQMLKKPFHERSFWTQDASSHSNSIMNPQNQSLHLPHTKQHQTQV